MKGTLTTWQEHLWKLSKVNKHDWIKLLREALDIFKGRIKGFAGVSDESEIWESLMMVHMKNLLWETLQLIIEKIKTGKGEESEELHKAIWVGIEFSMQIGAIDFLMTELFEEFS